MDNYLYKIVIVGDSQVGKTTFVHRTLTGEFNRNYVATLGVEVHPLTFYTNYGVVTFNVWDIAGKFPGELSDAYYTKAVGGIVMFDVTSQESYDNVPTHVKKLVKMGVPIDRIVICGNKVDERKRAVLPKNIKYPRENGIQYFEVSSKSNYNFEKPFWRLAQKLTGRDTLECVEAPTLSDREYEDEEENEENEEKDEEQEYNAPDDTWNSMEDVLVHGLGTDDMTDV